MFSLEIPSVEEIKEEIKPNKEEVTAIAGAVEKNVESVMNINMDSLEERQAIVKSIESFGLNTIQLSSEKSGFLQVTVGQLAKSGDEGGLVANGITELQKQMKELDPSGVDFAKTGFLGKLFNPLKSYFDKYQKAETVISDVVKSLDKGRSTLINDNTTLEIEEVALRNLTKDMMKEIELGSQLDLAISRQIEIATAQNADPDKIRFISEEILFPLRQRIMDMQQMLIVNQQGIIAMEVIRRNNKELIRGAERAKAVTVSALRVAVTVAGALYNQKIVLQKIEMLNNTTSEIISGTAKMLKEQGTAIQKQAMESTISVDKLKEAFADTLTALEDISIYKMNALPKMKETIDQFREIADEGEKHLLKMEKAGHLTIS